MQTDHGWTTALAAWRQFTKVHPELAYRDGTQQFYNFLRYYRAPLIERDVLRRAKGKFWIAHQERFTAAAFDLATGGIRRSEEKSNEPLPQAR